MSDPTPGGSGTGRTVAPQAQNVVIDANAQAAAAQMAQQILANTNVTLKQELVKIPDFWGEKGKDTVRLRNSWQECTSVKLQMTGTTRQPMRISASASEEKPTNGLLLK
jgi:hypothetical protein